MKLQVTESAKKAHEETIEDTMKAGMSVMIEDTEYIGDFPAGYISKGNNLKEA